MKIIFDFDDVIFDTQSFKQKVFSGLNSCGVDSEVVKGLYGSHRRLFNPSSIYRDVVVISGKNISEEKVNEAIDNLFQDIGKYIDKRITDIIYSTGKDNCFILTAGDEDFQRLKIQNSLDKSVINNEHVIFVKDNKDSKVKEICEKYPNESIIFVDDKNEHINEVAALNLKNLYPILYNKDGFDILSSKIRELS
ncbi:hypothetical protein K9M47_02535 [Candidatus Gracilibacteria bacterium]|nr:hypothetical protein [Candidatus Gracilibacteria bacterium]